MTREEQIDWLCRLRADLNNGVIFTPWNKEFTEALNDVLEQEPKTGKWISTETKGVRYAFWCRYKCSLCGELSDYKNFCPNCGARMVEPQESEDKE